MKSKRLYSSFTAEQVRAIGETAREILAETTRIVYGRDPSTPEQRGEANSAREPAVSALKLCSQAIAHLRDPSFFELALECAEWSNFIDGYGSSTDVEAGLAELIRCELLTPSQLQKVLRSHFDGARRVLARTIPAHHRSAPALLRRLTRDSSEKVRAIAKERLQILQSERERVAEFRQEVAGLLARGDATRYRKQIETFGKLLDASTLVEDADLCLELAREVPAPLACHVVRRVMLTHERVCDLRVAAQVLAASGELGERTFFELLDRIEAEGERPWELDEENAECLGRAYLDALPEQLRIPTLRNWLAVLRTAPEEAPRWMTVLARVVQALWPVEEDASPVIEVVIARSRVTRTRDQLMDELAWVLRKPVPIQPLLPKLVPLLIEGFPGSLEALRLHACNSLARLPKGELRMLAARARASGNFDAADWGIKMALGPAHARSDGPRRELALRFDDDPALRPVMRKHHVYAILPRLRAELVAGKLDFSTALQTMQAVGSMHGGFLRVSTRGADSEVYRATVSTPYKPYRRNRRAFLEHPDEVLPPTAAEWQAYRALRDVNPLHDPSERRDAVYCVAPDGVTDPVELAFVERLVEQSKPDDGLLDELAEIVAATGRIEHARLLDRIESSASGKFAEQLARARTAFRLRLGLRSDDGRPELTLVQNDS